MIRFNFLESSLEKSKKNVITGIISIQLEENLFFPEEKWNDSIIIILSWWLEEINNNNSFMKFYFMDGPYYFILINDEKSCKLKTSESDDLFIINKQTFIQELYNFGMKILQLCKNKNWNSSDLEKLKEILTR